MAGTPSEYMDSRKTGGDPRGEWKPKMPPPLVVKICDTCKGPRSNRGNCVSCYIEGRRNRGKEVKDPEERARLKADRAEKTRKSRANYRKRFQARKKKARKNQNDGIAWVRRRRLLQFRWTVMSLEYLQSVFETDSYGRYVVYEDKLHAREFEEKMAEIRATLPSLVRIMIGVDRRREILEGSKEDAIAEGKKRSRKKKPQPSILNQEEVL